MIFCYCFYCNLGFIYFKFIWFWFENWWTSVNWSRCSRWNSIFCTIAFIQNKCSPPLKITINLTNCLKNLSRWLCPKMTKSNFLYGWVTNLKVSLIDLQCCAGPCLKFEKLLEACCAKNISYHTVYILALKVFLVFFTRLKVFCSFSRYFQFVVKASTNTMIKILQKNGMCNHIDQNYFNTIGLLSNLSAFRSGILIRRNNREFDGIRPN